MVTKQHKEASKQATNTTDHNNPKEGIARQTDRTEQNTHTKTHQDQDLTQEANEFTDTWNTQWLYAGHGTWTQPEEPTHMSTTNVFKTAHTLDRLRMETDNADLMTAAQVRKKGYPNRYGARIPVKCRINTEELSNLLVNYEDKEVVEWLKYGWPTGRLPTMQDPSKTFKNHKGATDHPQALKDYIHKEIEKGAVLGPFSTIPFEDKVGISPISTRPKKNSTERRVIIDLSYPQGSAVNDGMIKDNYMGLHAKLTFPKTDDLALRIFQLGKNARMFKIDLSRYFRQLPLDPGDYSLIGYIIDNQLYFDKMLPMGMRTAPYIAQRVTNAIRHIHEQLHYFLLNYVDDFLGAEHKDKVWQAFEFLTELLKTIRVDAAPDKTNPPTTRIDFLGTIFDSQSMTIEVPEQKMVEIRLELQKWKTKKATTRKETESLIGKLQFAARCVRAGRVFISRLINWLRGMERTKKYQITQEAHKDIAWWDKFISTYNGISIMWLHKSPRTDQVIATDSCKKGFGGIAENTTSGEDSLQSCKTET